MQALCVRRSSLTPRLFQQACRLSTKNRKGSKANVKRPLRPLQQRQQQQQQQNQFIPPNDDGESIRWFEKDVQTGEVRRVAGNPEELEGQDVRQQMKALDLELQEYENPDEHGFDKALLDSLDPEDRVKVEKALAKRSHTEQGLVEDLEIRLELPPLSIPILKRLNESLRKSTLGPPSVTQRKELWRWYSRAKYLLPALARMIPKKAWDVLWRTQSVRGETNPGRPSHVLELLDDMIAGGLELTHEQQEERLEALTVLGRDEEAIAEWEQEYESTAGRDVRVLEFGVRLFAQIGDLDRAMTILRESFDNNSDTNPRIILPLLSAHLEIGNDHMAFALYTIMRSKLRRKMNMKDYDVVSLLFLAQGKKDLALAVFRDMMQHGNTAIKGGFLNETEQEQLYYATFQRLKAFGNISTSPHEINSVSLHAMTNLPIRWQNKYFYGSWIKKLIGMNHINAASQVVELMFERGVIPDSKHMNGLIAAYFRSDDPGLVDQGERLAWSMIQQRLDFVKKRDGDSGDGTLSDAPSTGRRIPTHISRPLPKATLETFNVLLLHYLVKANYQYMKYLGTVVSRAKIKIDSHFVAQMLYMTLYSNGPHQTWRSFHNFTRFTFPKMEIYDCIWTAQVRHLQRPEKGDKVWFPPPREVFLMMRKWYESLNPRLAAEAREDLTTEVAAKILQSFAIDKDWVGCLVAMHALHQLFDVAPNAGTARLITVAVSNIPDRPGYIRSTSRTQLSANEARTKRVAKVLKALRDRRAAAALEDGVKIDELEETARNTENINLLSELIRVVLVRSGMPVDHVEQAIEEASQEMGVGGINTGDKDASNVV